MSILFGQGQDKGGCGGQVSQDFGVVSVVIVVRVVKVVRVVRKTGIEVSIALSSKKIKMAENWPTDSVTKGR